MRLAVLAATLLALSATVTAAPAKPLGDFLRFPSIPSPELGESRSVTVYLPPSYRFTERRYPVLYLQDGQNVFNPTLHEISRWNAWQGADAQAEAGRELIIVAVDNRDRLNEYSPYREPGSGVNSPRADRYADFLANTLKPYIDARLRTQPDPAHTGVLGSSMGGLVSLYAAWRHPQVYGFAGVLSPSFWVGNSAIYGAVTAKPQPSVRYYLSAGTDEGADEVRDTRRMAALLEQQGNPVRLTIAPGDAHNETAWAKRLPEALSFFLGK